MGGATWVGANGDDVGWDAVTWGDGTWFGVTGFDLTWGDATWGDGTCFGVTGFDAAWFDATFDGTGGGGSTSVWGVGDTEGAELLGGTVTFFANGLAVATLAGWTETTGMP